MKVTACEGAEIRTHVSPGPPSLWLSNNFYFRANLLLLAAMCVAAVCSHDVSIQTAHIIVNLI